MGAVDTTYTFTATDTITSTKMNNIIDQTTITPDAIIGTTLDVSAGKLRIRSAGITSNELGVDSVKTASIEDGAVTQAKASNMLLPAGAVMAFAMNGAPTGWLAANGAAVSRTTYATLFAVIGTFYGAGDGSTTFTLPDLRGYFVRGFGANADGIASGAFGAKQADDFRSHAHKITPTSTVYAYVNNASSYNIGGGFQPGGATTPRYPDGNAYEGGSETRPRNIAMLYCIKI